MTLARGLEMLSILASGGEDGLGVSEICARANLHRVTAHRILSSLIAQGWVEQGATRKYRLGIEAWRIGLRANERFDLVRAGNPSLDAIEGETQDTTYLLKRHDNEAVCVARREGTYPLRFLVMDVGVSYPLGVGAATLAILAYMDAAESSAALSETEAKLSRFPRISMRTIQRMLRATRQRGFALSEGLIVPSACAVAVPIFDVSGRAIGSVACVAAKDRLTGDRLDFVVRVLRRETEAISRKLGGKAARQQPAREAKRRGTGKRSVAQRIERRAHV